MNTEIEELKKQIADKDRELNDLHSRISRLEDKEERLQDIVDERDNKISDLETEIEDLKERDEKLTRLEEVLKENIPTVLGHITYKTNNLMDEQIMDEFIKLFGHVKPSVLLSELEYLCKKHGCQ